MHFFIVCDIIRFLYYLFYLYMFKIITIDVKEVELPVPDSKTYWDVEALNKIKKDEHQRIFETYKMHVPTHVELHITEDLANRMLTVKNLSMCHNLNKVEFSSVNPNTLQRSLAYILENGKKIATTFYVESGTFPCYNEERFILKYDNFYEMFCINFYYKNSYSEQRFISNYFNL